MSDLKTKLKKTSKDRPRTDHIISGLIHSGKFRVALINATDSVREAQARHSTDPLTTIALGRALVCAGLCGSTLKNQFEYIGLSFQGDGPMRSVNAEYVAPSSLRGFVGVPQLALTLTEDDAIPEFVGEALGSGTLTVRRALQGAAPYSGVCELRSGEIAEDVAHYYLESEQIPTSVIAGVQLDKQGKVTAAAGLLIQKIGSDQNVDDLLDKIENNLKEYMAISKQVAEGKTIEQIADGIFGAEHGEKLDNLPVGFRCFCSRDRMQLGLLKLELSELKEIAAEQGEIETVCHYCGEKYHFEANEFEKH